MKLINCAAVFSDHCVLQRNKPIRVWGTAEHDTKIEVRLNGYTEEAVTVGHDWQVEFPAMEAGGPYALEVASEDRVYCHFKDVMIGEVWLAGGQSNMEFALQSDADGKVAMEQAESSNVRFYQVKQLAYKDDYFYRAEHDNCWRLPTNDVGTWSAVGYYFAKQLAAELKVTVGVIGCNWGGTSAAAWQDKESLCQQKETKVYWDEYAELLEAQDPEEYEKERLDYLVWHADWQPRMDAYYLEHPETTWDEAQTVVGACRWPGPMGPKHEFRPAGLYECMLQRVIPYTLGGVIFYQGESDDHRPHSYYYLFKNMIAVWRRDFMDEKLPFLCVQLPGHHYKDEPASDKWCYIREAQMKLHQEGTVTGIAVAIDCGEYNNIHPVHKTEVARRLALQALHHVYGCADEADVYGPVYRDYTIDGGGVIIEFDYAKQGFLVKGEEITGFEIAVADGGYVAAKASVQGNKLVLKADKIAVPVSVRYMWTDYAEVTLFGANGLPVAPFRTI